MINDRLLNAKFFKRFKWLKIYNIHTHLKKSRLIARLAPDSPAMIVKLLEFPILIKAPGVAKGKSENWFIIPT